MLYDNNIFNNKREIKKINDPGMYLNNIFNCNISPINCMNSNNQNTI